MVFAGSAGTVIAALGFGALGLIYRPNRIAGFVIVTKAAFGLMVAGANAQANCQFDSAGLKLCDGPDGWRAATPHAHAAAEFRRDDGFNAQLIIDAYGSDRGLTLSAAGAACMGGGMAGRLCIVDARQNWAACHWQVRGIRRIDENQSALRETGAVGASGSALRFGGKECFGSSWCSGLALSG